jgi:gamma-glutamyltranspeptidase/glutathione hydrolase
VSPRISRGWQRATAKLSQDPEATRVYLPAPKAGQLHYQPDLARTLQTISEHGEQAFYQGPLAKRIAGHVQSLGGYLTAEDLASHQATWETPIRTAYRGVEILEHPPNGQGLAALIALNIISGFDMQSMAYWSPRRWHIMIEAMRMGMVDAAKYVGDPSRVRIPTDELLSMPYAERRRSRIQLDRSLPLAAPGQIEHKDTVYLTVVDADGNAVSFINSLFDGFGSGIVVPGTGICLQNRGACFSLEEGHLNALAGSKRPYHTIIPAIALRDGALWLSFGVMGDFMQPQGHLQVVSNMVDYDLDPQAALDAPRFRVDERGGPRVSIERGAPANTRRALAAIGHKLDVQPTFSPVFGGGQVIAVDPESGALWAGSEPRNDGCAYGF